MSIQNVLASVPVRDLAAAKAWYTQLIGRPPEAQPMPELAEWRFERGGCLQVYQGPERAGGGSFTLAVDDLDAEIAKLDAMQVDTRQRTSGPQVRTVMVGDPDGNRIALAQALDDALAK